MKTRIVAAALSVFLFGLNIVPSEAAWSESKEIFSGAWGKGTGQLGLRSEGGYDVAPKIEAVTADKEIIVSDPANKKQVVFSSSGKFLSEVKWDDPKGEIRKAVAPLSERGRIAQIVRSMQIGSGTYRITVVFSDKNAEVLSDTVFSQAVRDAAGSIYGIGAEQVTRFDRNGKQTASLVLPRDHEEIAPVPGSAPRPVYIVYGAPVIAPNGDVYLLQRSDTKFSILKYTWQE